MIVAKKNTFCLINCEGGNCSGKIFQVSLTLSLEANISSTDWGKYSLVAATSRHLSTEG